MLYAGLLNDYHIKIFERKVNHLFCFEIIISLYLRHNSKQFTLNKTIMIQPRIQSIILHLDNLEALRCLTAASMGNVIFALMNYAACGEMPQFKNRALMAVFHLLRAALDRDMAKYQTRCGGTAAKTAAAPTANTAAPTANTAAAAANTAAAKKTGSHDDGTANAVSPHTPLNNNNNNNNNSHHDDDSAREETKMEGGIEKGEAAISEAMMAELATTAEPTLADNAGAAACTEPGAEGAATDGALNAETLNGEDLSFQQVYALYDKPAGDAFFAQSIWNSLTDDERRAAIVYIKDYVKMRPNKVYRKKFCNFLQQRTWETEPLTDYRRPAARQENPNDCTTHTNKYRHGRREETREETIDYYRKLLAADGYDYDSLFANY